MALEALKNSTLPRILGDTVSDFADLIQKELHLARAEISEKLIKKANGAGFLAVAGLLGLVSFVLILQAAIFGIASYGISLHWAAAIVGVVVLIVAGILFLIGRARLSDTFTPTRTVDQVKQDLRLVKERLQ